MVSHRIKTSKASVADDHPDVHSTVESEMGLSLSRRVKIGVVLMLTLIGYFLVDDRPQPAMLPAPVTQSAPAADSDMQQFVDDLQFVDDSPAPAAPAVPTPEAPLQVPVAAAAPPVSAPPMPQPQASPAPAWPAVPPQQNQLAAVETTGSHQPQQRAYQNYVRGPEIRTVLRFTGRIDPIR